MRESRELPAILSDRYRLVEQVGRGGMATVYRADDRETGSRVAIKILRPELTAILGPTRFHREIEILGRLRHRNIVPLLDSSEAGANLYYVMPFVEGETLRARLARSGMLPLDEVLSITRQVADAIDSAHAQGVLHRDIKPANILLEAGRALICDFGVARAIEAAGSESFSSSGLIVGTPAYMSPEQATGAKVDRGTDIYALGCVVYEMLAGDPPFTGATAQAIMARQLAGVPRSIRTMRPELSIELERAVIKSLHRDPLKRPAAAARFAEALR
jgi:serine/threonine-protein kinase